MMNKAARTGYREAQLNCPNCKALLEVQEILGSPVDCCRDCGGLWVDWFDGDLPGIVRGTREAAAEDGRGGRDRKAPSGKALSGSALPHCPRCSRPLAQEQFQQTGPTIYRCGECLGAYVPAERAAELARFVPADEAGDAGRETGFWRGLIERIRLVLGRP